LKKLFEKYRGRLVRLNENVVGTVCGYTQSHFILLLENGLKLDYSFSLDELGRKEYYIDTSFEEGCEECLYCYINENHITKK
jgi:hypothetical protein